MAWRAAAWIVSLTGVWLLLAPMPVWGQWNGTNPIWTNSNVGIGTASPAARLSLGFNSTGMLHFGIVDQAIYGGNAAGNLHIDSVAGMYLNYYSNQPLYLGTGNVGIGTTSPQYKLAVNGVIGAKDIIVTNTGWSDYVFRPDYVLRPLREVEDYIRVHGHLPDIPSEPEVTEKGISLGEMQARLLAKVEELTLHLIRQEKENKELWERLGQLERSVAANNGASAGR